MKKQLTLRWSFGVIRVHHLFSYTTNAAALFSPDRREKWAKNHYRKFQTNRCAYVRKNHFWKFFFTQCFSAKSHHVCTLYTTENYRNEQQQKKSSIWNRVEPHTHSISNVWFCSALFSYQLVEKWKEILKNSTNTHTPP